MIFCKYLLLAAMLHCNFEVGQLCCVGALEVTFEIKKSHICKHMRENFDFFLFLSYFYTFSFKNRLPSPLIGRLNINYLFSSSKGNSPFLSFVFAPMM